MEIVLGDIATLYHDTGVILATITSSNADVFAGQITHCGYTPELETVLKRGKSITFDHGNIFGVSKRD